MSPVLLVPGIQNSGPAHWQSRWEALHAGVQRVQQRDWDHPEAEEWVATLDTAVRACPAPPVIVAHSLGCLVAARWAATSALPVRALVLVAVPDPAGPSFPAEARGFEPVPAALPGRPVVLASSRDDPYASPAWTARCVAAWQAEHHDLGARGHLNAASGLGDWPEGWAWVEQRR